MLAVEDGDVITGKEDECPQCRYEDTTGGQFSENRFGVQQECHCDCGCEWTLCFIVSTIIVTANGSEIND
jgi:hypothetical protein